MGGHNVSVQALGGVSRSEGRRCFLAGGVGGALACGVRIGCHRRLQPRRSAPCARWLSFGAKKSIAHDQRKSLVDRARSCGYGGGFELSYRPGVWL